MIIEGLGTEQRAEIERLRGEDYFWLDVVARDDTREALRDTLQLPDHALVPLLTFGRETRPGRKWHADGEHVVFAFTAFVDYEPEGEGEPDALDPIEVHVLVHGDYILTVHEEELSLAQMLDTEIPEDVSEQYIVYSVLEEMLATSFDALNQVELTMADLEEQAANVRGGSVKMQTLRAISHRLSEMRRRIAPQRGIFERVATEISHVKGLSADSESYFERIYSQLNRLVNAIDAAAQALAQIVDLRLNETNYWLTVVATIFLPLTFITGFFGMNFGWMIDHVDSALAFFTLGVGGCLLGVITTVYVVQRRASPAEEDQPRKREVRLRGRPESLR